MAKAKHVCMSERNSTLACSCDAVCVFAVAGSGLSYSATVSAMDWSACRKPEFTLRMNDARELAIIQAMNTDGPKLKAAFLAADVDTTKR